MWTDLVTDQSIKNFNISILILSFDITIYYNIIKVNIFFKKICNDIRNIDRINAYKLPKNKLR